MGNNWRLWFASHGMPVVRGIVLAVFTVAVLVVIVRLISGSPEPNQRWIQNGAVLLVVIAVLALILVAVGALAILAATAWAALKRQPSPLSSLTTSQTHALRNNAAVTVLFALIVGGLAAIPFLVQVVQPPLHTGLRLWLAAEFSALGILLVGATFGFLFGLPHFNDVLVAPPPAAAPGGAPGATTTMTVSTMARPASGPTFTPSSNLEKVSAQLVTFFSGLAFASLLTIPQYINQFALFFQSGLKGSGGSLVGAGLLTYFGPLGFITAYVITRTIGAQAFARSDTELMGISVAVTNTHPMLPDVPEGSGEALSPADRVAVAAAAGVPFSELSSVDDFRAWGRAHSLLGDNDGALRAFDRAYQMRSDDPRIVLDYATALYQDPKWTDAEYVLRKAKDAEALETAASSATLRSRTQNLKVAAQLYVPKGYVGAVIDANAVLNSDLPPLSTTHFYRACGLGQLLWAYAEDQRVAVNSAGWNAVMAVIRFDAAITMELGEAVRKQLKGVIDPSARECAPDSDLQYGAHYDTKLCDIAKVPQAPPLPGSTYAPVPTDVPDLRPPGGKPGDWDAIVIAWVQTFPSGPV